MFLKIKLSLTLAFAVALSGGLVAPSHAETAAQKKSRAGIAAAYKKWGQAVMRKDIATYAAMEGADFQCYSPMGVATNRDRDISGMQMMFSLITQIPKMEYKITSLKWRGPDAIVGTQTTMVTMMIQGSRKQRSEITYTTRDYWTLMPQGWQIRQSVQKTIKMWVDGKRMV